LKIILISPAESGTTNRRLLDKKVILDFKKPFVLAIPKDDPKLIKVVPS